MLLPLARTGAAIETSKNHGRSRKHYTIFLSLMTLIYRQSSIYNVVYIHFAVCSTRMFLEDSWWSLNPREPSKRRTRERGRDQKTWWGTGLGCADALHGFHRLSAGTALSTGPLALGHFRLSGALEPHRLCGTRCWRWDWFATGPTPRGGCLLKLLFCFGQQAKKVLQYMYTVYMTIHYTHCLPLFSLRPDKPPIET